MQPEKRDFISNIDGLKDNFFVHDAGRNTTCMVMLHGHGSHGDQPWTRPDLAAVVQPLLKKYKLSLLSPNLRDNAWMSPAAVTDLRDILLLCKAEYHFARYIFMSGSMGGTGALIFAIRHPELVDALGVMGAATDIARYRDFCATGNLPVHRSICDAITTHYHPEDYAAHNVCSHWERLTMPLAFYHGADDTTMPVSELITLREKMCRCSNAEFKIVPGDHNAPWHNHLEEIFEKVSGLRDYLPMRDRSSEAPRSTPLHFAKRDNYELSIYFLGKYFANHPASPEVPECLVHARAFAYMTENLPLTFPSEQIFFGGIEQFRVKKLPPEISETDYRKYFDTAIHRGMRNFSVSWDHAAPDYNTLMEQGLADFISRAEKSFAKSGSPVTGAMLITLQAVSNFFLRAAEHWAKERPAEAARLRHIATRPPADFAEALQLMWGVFVILEAQGRRHNALARMDQYLYEAFKKSRPDLTTAENMLCHIFCKVEEFHEVTNICIGGVKSDGSDAVNELSYLILEAVGHIHRASTNLSARLHRDSSREFMLACIKLIASGIGFPAIMNDEVYIPALIKCGIPLEAARDYALFGCVEGNIPGRAPAWSDSRFNLGERFISVIENLESFDSYEELWQSFAAAVRTGLQQHLANYNAKLQEFPPENYPDPLLSALTRSCIEKNKDINDGGADFPRQHGTGMTGPATIADSLAAVKKLVFEEKRIGKKELLDALHRNFEGEEILRQTLINCAPKYGNDDPYVDNIFADIVKLCGETSGVLRCCMASNIQNVSLGREIPATPDGRFAGTPLSDAASPSGGMDCNGPTAFINSITTPDYSDSNCTVVNMRFLPEMFESEAGYENMLVLLKKFIAGKGHEIQFNVIGNELLNDAVAHPEKYGDLLVRVSGFSAFFTKLSPEVQQDIIRRNAHGR